MNGTAWLPSAARPSFFRRARERERAQAVLIFADSRMS